MHRPAVDARSRGPGWYLSGSGTAHIAARNVRTSIFQERNVGAESQAVVARDASSAPDGRPRPRKLRPSRARPSACDVGPAASVGLNCLSASLTSTCGTTRTAAAEGSRSLWPSSSCEFLRTPHGSDCGPSDRLERGGELREANVTDVDVPGSGVNLSPCGCVGLGLDILRRCPLASAWVRAG